MLEKLTSKDYRFLLFCVLISAICLGFGLRYFYVAFPEASIDFEVTQGQSEQIARQFLHDRGFDVSRYRHAAQFDYDDNAKVFLERELGLAKANPLFGSRVRIWRWSHRWFVPLQREEFSVEVSPKGEIVSFSHTVAETLPGMNLTQDLARSFAETYLSHVARRSPATLDFVEAATEVRPKRTDHIFTWKEKDFSVKDSDYRVEVRIQGNQIAGYSEYLHVPEKWLRDYEKLRSLNTLAGGVDGFFMVLTALAILIMFGVSLAKREIKYRLAFAIGLTGTVLVLLTQLNSFSSSLFGYATTESYDSFVTRKLALALFVSLVAGAMFYLLTAAAEPQYRRGYPGKLSLAHLFTPRGLRTRTFFLELVLGLTLTFFFFAYQTAFYLLANRFGAWSPADIPYTDLLNTRFPWVAVLLIGFMPAISEEFIFRMFSIPFLQRFLKFTALAVVIPAFIWGFGHATYPNQPFFIRGLEVGIAGILVGIVMLRWGIFAALVWHFTVDALYTALLLLRSSNSYFVISGAVSAGILVLPLLLCLIAYFKHKGFASQEGLTNPVIPEGIETEMQCPKVEEGPLPGAYRPLSKRSIAIWGLIAAAGLTVFLIKVPQIGSHIRFNLTAQQARAAADKALAQQDVDLRPYRAATSVSAPFGPLTSKYILQRRDIQYLNHFWENQIRIPSWTARYFQPLQKEEYQVDVDPTKGEAIAITHVFPEEQPGAQLSEDSAQAIATRVLRSVGIDTSGFVLKESEAEQKKARRDYDFTWEAKDATGLNLDEAKYRFAVSIAGDKVATSGPTLKLPEAWTRDQKKQPLWKTVCAVLAGLAIAALFVNLVVAFVCSIRDRAVPWRRVLALSGVSSIVFGLLWLNQLPTIYSKYETSMALGTFQTLMGVSGLMMLVIGFLGGILLLGFAFGVDPSLAGLLRRAGRAAYARDALIGVLLLLFLRASATQFNTILVGKFSRFANPAGLPVPEGISTFLPSLDILLGSILSAAQALALFAAGAYLWRHKLRWLFVAVAFGGMFLFILASSALKTGPEMALRLAPAGIYLILGVLFVRFVARDNALLYALAGFALPTVQNGMRLFSQGAPWFRWNGLAIMAAVALILLWILAENLAGEKRKSG